MTLGDLWNVRSAIADRYDRWVGGISDEELERLGDTLTDEELAEVDPDPKNEGWTELPQPLAGIGLWIVDPMTLERRPYPDGPTRAEDVIHGLLYDTDGNMVGQAHSCGDAPEEYQLHAQALDDFLSGAHSITREQLRIVSLGEQLERRGRILGYGEAQLTRHLAEQSNPQIHRASGEPGADHPEQLVTERLDWLRADRRARELLAAENAPAFEGYDSGTLGELLAREPDPPMRIEGLLPAGGNMVVSAQNKTGKTTFVLNLARSLLHGEPFLGQFNARRISGSVAVWNYEVSGPQFARWAKESQIDFARLFVMNLRGYPSPFTDPRRRAEASRLLREHQVEALIVDPFGRAFTGQEQNSNSEVQRWLDDLDVFKREAGIEHAILTTHAGWSGEHSRGASALEGWPDTIVTLTRNDQDQRFVRAEGRDVYLAEDKLAFDPEARRLSLTGEGSRSRATARAAATRLEPAVLDALEGGPLRAKQISERLREKGVAHKDTARVAAVKSLLAQGLIRLEGQAYQLT